nr:MAG TPA: transposase [Caudoviricetes sp.]
MCGMEYYGNKLCISYPEFVDSGIVSVANYKQLASRGRIDVVRHGGGASGCCALISIDSLPSKYKAAVEKMYPGGDEVRIKTWVLSNYEMDQAAVAFFHDRSKTGIDLDEKKKREYIINASVLNCCIKLYERARDSQRLFGGRYNWDMMAKTIETLREELGHTLPASTLRFRKKVNDYKRNGYGCLISGKFGNQSARKVDYKTKQLVRGLAVLPNKPYNSNVHEMYISFVCGELDVYDPKTGELFNPDDFTDKNGDPKFLSESTINNILNEPATKMLIEKSLSSWSTFMHEQKPYMHRHSGQFSLSQITMDDVDLTRKLKDTKQRVHAYYAYDVVSQCVIGASYARKKDERLVVDCFRDMFRLIARNDWGIPAGIEVENHLMSQYKEGFLKAETVFQFVRFCAPLNSQEKYAEPLNGAKKRSVIHKNHEGIGRFYGKGKWRQEYQKISDETNELYEDKEYFTWEQLVADDRKDNEEWNNMLHPNQKMYPGMTRWQVLEANINPNLLPYDARTLAYHIGERVETSIRRNSTVRVAHEDWWLSSTSVLERLEPNNYKVTACYLPDDEGAPQEVFIYQKGKYIDTVEKVNTYSRVMAEQTEEDQAAFVEQQKKIAKFNKYVEDNAIDRLGILKPSQQAQQEVLELKSPAPLKYEPKMPLPSASDRAVADI